MRSLVRSAFFLVTVLTLFFLPRSVFADTLFISPSSGTYTQGQTFSVRIMVSSQSQAINAVSAALSFPADTLQVVSISKIGSILNLWVEEPSYSNTAGTVSLEGVVPNPGFTGSNGPVVIVNFRVIRAGSANLRFSSGSLLANDGYGTNILKSRGTASYTLVTPTASENLEAVPAPQEESAIEPALYIDLNERSPKEDESKPASKTISFEIPQWKDIYGWLLKFLSVAIPLVALVFLLTHTFVRGVGNIRTLRRSLRKDLHNIDRVVGKSFDNLREDIVGSIHILEKAKAKRRLTDEEDAILRHLRQNLINAEKAIHKELIKAEKDIGD